MTPPRGLNRYSRSCPPDYSKLRHHSTALCTTIMRPKRHDGQAGTPAAVICIRNLGKREFFGQTVPGTRRVCRAEEPVFGRADHRGVESRSRRSTAGRSSIAGCSRTRRVSSSNGRTRTRASSGWWRSSAWTRRSCRMSPQKTGAVRAEEAGGAIHVSHHRISQRGPSSCEAASQRPALPQHQESAA